MDNSDKIEIVWGSNGEPPVFKVDGEERITFNWTKNNLRLVIESEFLDSKPELENLPGFETSKRLGSYIDAKAAATPTLEFESVKSLLEKK